MRYTIGLDIGIASVGWAVINNDKSRIEDLGVRVFKKAEEADGKSLNLARREARSARKRLRRRAARMKKVKELFLKYNLVSEKELSELYIITDSTKDVWELRAKGLDELLDRKDWARVLTNIAKRRGYKSNRKTDEEDKEVGKLTTGTKENKKILEEKEYRTIGEMFYKDEKFKNNKRNKGGEYNNTVLRSMLIDEVCELFKAQRKYKSNFASEKFEEEYIEVVCYQKEYITPELLEKMLGKCTLEKEEHRAPKNSYTFERFTLLQKVNNLNIDISGEKLDIGQAKKQEIINLAYEQSEIKYTQLRKKLNLPKEARFKELNYNKIKKNKDDLTEEEIIKQIEDKKFVKLEGWHKIRLALKADEHEEVFESIRREPELQDVIADALVRNKTDQTIKKYLEDRKVNEIIINSVLKINFTKFGHLSYKAMKKIIPELEAGLTYDKACENAGYEFKGTKNELQSKLPPLLQLDSDILNPVVLRAVSQTRKVINAIIDKYGSPTAIYIETARELSKSYDDRQIIKAKQNENEKDNEKIKEYIRETFHFEPKPFDIVKMKLWREQNGKCIYSGKAIPAERLYEENYVQVDHIIPFSRCFDDSYNNKVIVLTDENQKKKEKTPFEYFGEDENKWHMFEELVNFTYKFNTRKRENLLIKSFSEEKSKDWIERNINDTKYIAKFMYNYISNNLKFADSELKRKVYNISGQATAILRHYWGLKKDRNESDKHHAQDAVIIACATNQNIKKVSEYSKRKVLYLNKEIVDEESGEIIDFKYNTDINIKEPWPKFREEVEARMEDLDNNGELYALKHGNFRNYDDVDISKIKPIFVSRMPERKITGRAHKDTMRSQKFIKQGYNFTVVKKPLKNITKQEIESIINNKEFIQLYSSDKNMYDDIYQKMKDANFKAEKAFANEYRKHSKTGNSPIVRSIKVPSMGNTGVRLKNNAIAENASMVRIDVFERDSKYYLVPIYVSDFSKNQLPNKAIVSSKDEDEWIEMTEKYEFKFSLYPNDLVKIKKKNEKEFYAYYNSTHRGTSAINLLSINGERKIEGIGVRNLEIFDKYQVDILGNISKVKKEKKRRSKKKMSWRSVIITQPTKLSIKNRQLKITQDEEWSIPLEDISSVVLENPQVSISSKAMSSMAENKVVMYTCDDKHLPNGVFIPFACHSRELKTLKQQLECTESFNKRCCQKIIMRKILNQAEVLKICDKPLMGEYLENLSLKVNSGDTQNREAIAAKGYFSALFGKKFSRENENIYNASLNYGYSIIRGNIARTLVTYGYIPAIGIHHKNELNNYNLADDFIEPFRPIVDMWVKMNINDKTEFDKYARAEILNLLNVDVKIQGKLQSVNNAINIMIASYTTAINQNDYKKLELPEILPIKIHEYE